MGRGEEMEPSLGPVGTANRKMSLFIAALLFFNTGGKLNCEKRELCSVPQYCISSLEGKWNIGEKWPLSVPCVSKAV
jgi:hypothetical protein